MSIVPQGKKGVMCLTEKICSVLHSAVSYSTIGQCVIHKYIYYRYNSNESVMYNQLCISPVNSGFGIHSLSVYDSFIEHIYKKQPEPVAGS